MQGGISIISDPHEVREWSETDKDLGVVLGLGVQIRAPISMDDFTDGLTLWGSGANACPAPTTAGTGRKWTVGLGLRPLTAIVPKPTRRKRAEAGIAPLHQVGI